MNVCCKYGVTDLHWALIVWWFVQFCQQHCECWWCIMVQVWWVTTQTTSCPAERWPFSHQVDHRWPGKCSPRPVHVWAEAGCVWSAEAGPGECSPHAGTDGHQGFLLDSSFIAVTCGFLSVNCFVLCDILSRVASFASSFFLFFYELMFFHSVLLLLRLSSNI